MTRLLILTSIFIHIFTISQSEAHALVVPNVNLDVNGDLENRYPLLVDGGLRFQQVYDGTEFGSFAAGGEFITGMALRLNTLTGAPFGPITIENLTISLSTTNAEPDSLSTIFADNVGGNNVVVLDGSATISSSNSAGAGNTRAFDVVINFQTPFLYDPVGGNLLLDILNADTSDNHIGTHFDATETLDNISRVYSDEGFSICVERVKVIL